MRRLLARLRHDERGQVAVEFAGLLLWLLLAALLIWELLLVAWTFNQASNAARTASRVDARGGDAEKAGRHALSPGLREGAIVRMDGEKATVKVRIPIIIPGLNSDDMLATRTAELPG